MPPPTPSRPDPIPSSEPAPEPRSRARRHRKKSPWALAIRRLFPGRPVSLRGRAQRSFLLATTYLVDHFHVPAVPLGGNRGVVYQIVKRLLDVVGSAAAIALFSPFMLAALATLLVTTRGKPFYWQRRIGEGGRPLWICKFRTMQVGADRKQHLVQNEHQTGPIFKNKRDPRVTRVGRILRKTSIDEMPQLFNVLFGSMSLVGPRPPVAREVAKYEPWQLERLSVKPGLTCLWQVSGRSEIEFDDWMRMDAWYVRHQSLWTDVLLLLRTPWHVLTGRGAY